MAYMLWFVLKDDGTDREVVILKIGAFAYLTQTISRALSRTTCCALHLQMPVRICPIMLLDLPLDADFWTCTDGQITKSNHFLNL